MLVIHLKSYIFAVKINTLIFLFIKMFMQKNKILNRKFKSSVIRLNYYKLLLITTILFYVLNLNFLPLFLKKKPALVVNLITILNVLILKNKNKILIYFHSLLPDYLI